MQIDWRLYSSWIARGPSFKWNRNIECHMRPGENLLFFTGRFVYVLLLAYMTLALIILRNLNSWVVTSSG